MIIFSLQRTFKMVKGKDPESESQKNAKITKIVFKGTIPVDPYVTNKNCKVLVDNDQIYSATLNQSNVIENNNKFYVLQILQSESNPGDFYFYTRWGRVGHSGKSSQIGPLTKSGAIRNYHNKLSEKTGSGNYRLVEMSYEGEEQNPKEQQKKEQKLWKSGQDKKDEPKSSLDPKVQSLIKMIFDMSMMNSQMKQIGYDSSKMPLGKLAKSSIMKGYEALNKLMETMIKDKQNKDLIAKQSNEFYSYIPHDFGFRHMSHYILDSEQKIKRKLQMLQSLQDIKIYTNLIAEQSIAGNQIDSNYLKLNTEITPLEKSTDEFRIIQKYVENTHGNTHSNYKLHIEDVFTVHKKSEAKRYKHDLHNKQLLWHGSRLTNYVGILSKGLRIAPPQAPVTGYMFGKGVYFADMVSKSANYCHAGRGNNRGLMLLCQVALGNFNEKYYGDSSAHHLPHGKHSTKGCGKSFPDGGQTWNKIWVPNGPAKTINHLKGDLLYNEYIVYDLAQIFCRYLLKMKFIYH